MSKSKIWPEEVLRPRLDELFSDEPSVSPPTPIKVAGAEVEICFRALSRQDIEYLKWEGWRRVMDDMEIHKIPPKDFIESAQGVDALNNENQVRLLHAAMIDPKAWEHKSIQPAFSLKKLRENAAPEELNAIDDQWVVWQTHKSLDGLTPEQITELREEAKKKSPDIRLLLRYGVGGLWTFTTFLAAECDTLQTNNALLGGGGDPQLMTSTLEGDSESIDSPPWFTRLSASLDEKILESNRDLQTEITKLKEEVDELKRGA